MALTISQNQLILSNFLVAYAASIGITINPNIWTLVPGSISETDYKLLLLNTIASGMGFQQQENDLFQSQQETLIASAPPQTAQWYQNQMLLFQFNSSIPQVPQIQPSTTANALAIVWNQVNPQYRVISFCIAVFGSAGRCLIKVAAISNGLPANLDSIYPGALAAATSFVNLTACAGISYIVTSGNSDWLFLQIDLYYSGVYSSVIFDSVSSAITSFLNSLSQSGFSTNTLAVFKLSALEDAILQVPGVTDMEYINVALRPDVAYPGSTATTWGTTFQEYLVSDSDENNRSWETIAGYISLENGSSTGGSIPNSQLGQYRVGSSGVLNLNCIPV